MSLPVGTTVGPYQIVGAIGAGGMGEVYRARDPRLARDVALKALPQEFADDPDRVSRFHREAQILASLNHPHIAAIYGIEEIHASSRFLVLELVEGETLAHRLAGRPVAVDRALAIARQIADALEAAHAKGIVHRDLKPANIGLTTDGAVKVLDFGIAKAAEPEAATETQPTVASLTRVGVVVGTAAYMSPEQARGLPTDKRTDIWAFGCLLYEMLTGQRAFSGATTSDVIVEVLQRQPDWKGLPPATPPRLRWLLERCLAKDPKQRLHDIADARIEIDAMLAQPFETIAVSRGVRPRERTAWAIAAVSLLAAIAALAWNRTGGVDPATAIATHTASIVLPDDLRLAGPSAGRFALSPDGRQIAMIAADASGTSRLYIRRLDSRTAQPLGGTEGAAFPFWSPDSRFVAFLAQNRLKKIAVSGGDVVTLADASFGATGAWNEDDVILFTPRGNAPLFRVSATSGAAVPATTLVDATGDVQHSFPSFLPDGRHFLFFVVGSTGGQIAPRGVYLGALDRDTPIHLLLNGAANAQYANGHLIFIRAGVLFAQRFDPEHLQLDGEAVPLVSTVETLDRSVSDVTGAFTVSQTGILAYQSVSRFLTQLTWFDRRGAVLSTIGERGDYTDVALSPDGSRVATSVMNPEHSTRDLWTFDVARGIGERLTFESGHDFGPNWSPDGTRLVFSSHREGSVHLYEKASSGSLTETTIREDDLGKFNPRPSPDGRYLIYVAGGGIIARSDIWVLARSGEGEARPFVETPFVESQPQFSPDGRWVAFMSAKSGRPEVYVSRFPRGERETLVSTAGGSLPRWNRNNRELFYVAPDGMLTVVDVRASDERLEVGAARRLFAIRSRPARLDAFPYDVAPTGDRILVNAFAEERTAPITLVVNWLASR